MIEINLVPGTQKKKRGKGPAPAGRPMKMPSGLPSFDRMTAFIVGAWIIGPLLIAWLFFSVRSDRADLEVSLDQAVADSTRYANVIATQQSLRARQDTIAQKLAMIQEIDAARYVWPHVLEEISMALPPYTWLTGVFQLEGGDQARFQLEGRTGSLPALTRYMDALEASPFLRNIQLVSSEQVAVGPNNARVAHSFVLTGAFEQPPLGAIETVPLFEDAMEDTATEPVTARSEATDGTGTS